MVNVDLIGGLPGRAGMKPGHKFGTFSTIHHDCGWGLKSIQWASFRTPEIVVLLYSDNTYKT